MLSNLKILFEHKIKSFYFVLGLNVTSLFFELLCLISIPFFVTSIFNPELVIEKLNFYNLNNLLYLDSQNLIYFSILFVVSSFLLKNFFLIFILIYQGKLLKHVKISLEKKVFNYYIDLPFKHHSKNNPANILRSINDEVMGFYNYAYHYLLFVKEIFTLILIFIIFSITNLNASLVISLFFLILIFFYVKYIKPIIKIRASNNQTFRKNMSQSIIESFKAVQDIKIYNKEKYVKKIFLNNVYNFENNHFIFGLISKLPRVVLEIISVFVGLIFIIFILNSGISLNSELLSILALFAIGIIRFIPAFNAVAVSLNYLKIFKVSVKLLVNELKKFYELEKENKLFNTDYIRKIKNKSYLYLKNVSYDYEANSSFKIKPFSIQIKKGKKIALIGKTGSGKSTFNYLLIGLLKPKTGNIFYNGTNIHEIDKKWKNKIGYVSQNIFLFNTSIKNNIILFNDNKSIDEIKLKKALKIANLEEKIKTLNYGTNSGVGIDGLNLSGGERQRVAIARAIYKDPEILVLDEFTSAIDNKTKTKILNQLFSVFKKKTIILITHDSSIARKCDEIYSVSNGIFQKK